MNKYLFTNKKAFIEFLILVPIRAFSAVAVTFVITSIIDFATSGSLVQLPKYLLLFGVYILFEFIVNVLNAKLHFRIIQDSTIKLKSDIYHKIYTLSKQEFEQKSIADYISLMETDIDVVKETYYTLLDMIADFMRMFVAIIVVFVYSWKIGLFIIITVLLQAIIPLLFNQRLEKVGREYTQTKSMHMNALKEYLGAFITTKIFHAENNLEHRYNQVLVESEKKWNQKEYLQEYVNDISYIFNKIAYLGIFLLGGYLMLQNEIQLATIVAITNIVTYISAPSLYLVDDIAKIKASKESFHKIFSLLSHNGESDGILDLEQSSYDLSISHLSFKYTSKTILDGITYTFKKGNKYLIIGKSGGGKSTLLNLLARLQTNYQGTISLDNEDINKITSKSLTRIICVIEQEPFLFNDSIYHNITLYDKSISKEKVLHALDQVGLSYLKNSLDSPLKENAKAISGGEKQRIALARALVRDTPILLLDESTSHLDKNTASEIEQIIFNIPNTTVILISHNATNIATTSVNHILRMENARLIEIK